MLGISKKAYICVAGTPKGGAREATKTTRDSPTSH